MTANQMIALMNRSPFVPLEIHLSDGVSIHVEEPYQITTSRNSPTCTVYEGNDRMRIITLRNVTEVITKNVSGL